MMSVRGTAAQGYGLLKLERGMQQRLPVLSYRDLRVWQSGMDLVVESYRIAKKLPKYEQYGLASQIRRAAVSIPSNIAEGHGRLGLRGYLYFLSVAASSLRELETQLLLSVRLEHVRQEEIDGCLKTSADLARMLAGLARKLKSRTPNP